MISSLSHRYGRATSPFADGGRSRHGRRSKFLAIIQAAPQAYRAFFCCAGVTGCQGLGNCSVCNGSTLIFRIENCELSKVSWRGQLVPPKTPTRSVRTIYFGSALANTVEEHFQHAVHRGPDDFVFSKKDGSPLHPDILRKDVLYPILDKLGIARSARTSRFSYVPAFGR